MTTPILDELAFAGAEHLDPGYVEAYDRKARVDVSDDLATLDELGLSADSTLVDLGAGTGTFALAAAAHCRRVVAVDISPAMVDAMRTRAAERGVANVEPVHAGFLSYDHTGPKGGSPSGSRLHPSAQRTAATRGELETHLRQEFSTFSWLLEPILEQAGFEIEQADYGRVGVYAEYVCRKRRG